MEFLLSKQLERDFFLGKESFVDILSVSAFTHFSLLNCSLYP